MGQSKNTEARDRLPKEDSYVMGIVESAMDAIVTVDEEQRILLFNATTEQMFSCAAAGAIGQPLGRFIRKRFREAVTVQLAGGIGVLGGQP